MVRVNMGRKKVEMKKMTIESNLQVTFSKRKAGLFKKVAELCTLCHVQVVLVLFSPGNKAFSFGNPSVESVIDRFLGGNHLLMDGSTAQMLDAHRTSNIQKLNLEYTHRLEQAEERKKRSVELKKMKMDSQDKCWWEAPLEEQCPQQLYQFDLALLELKRELEQKLGSLINENATNAEQCIEEYVGFGDVNISINYDDASAQTLVPYGGFGTIVDTGAGGAYTSGNQSAFNHCSSSNNSGISNLINIGPTSSSTVATMFDLSTASISANVLPGPTTNPSSLTQFEFVNHYNSHPYGPGYY